MVRRCRDRDAGAAGRRSAPSIGEGTGSPGPAPRVWQVLAGLEDAQDGLSTWKGIDHVAVEGLIQGEPLYHGGQGERQLTRIHILHDPAFVLCLANKGGEIQPDLLAVACDQRVARRRRRLAHLSLEEYLIILGSGHARRATISAQSRERRSHAGSGCARARAVKPSAPCRARSTMAR